MTTAPHKIGSWFWDEAGLPAYAYTGPLSPRALDTARRDAALPPHPCFLLGNYKMTLFAYVGGRFDLISGEHGWAGVNFDASYRGQNGAALELFTPQNDRVRYPLVSDDENPLLTAQHFGIGYAAYSYKTPENLCIRRTLSVPLSLEVNRGTPAFLLTVTLKNNGKTPQTLHYREHLLPGYRMMNDRANASPAVIYMPSTHRTADTVLAAFSAQPAKFLLPPKTLEGSYTHDMFPPTLFLRVLSPNVPYTLSETASHGEPRLACDLSFTLAPGETRTLQLAVGFIFTEQADLPAKLDQITAVTENLRENADLSAPGAFSSLWQQKLPVTLQNEKDDTLRCEILWNAYVLEAMATYNRYFGETYIPQGSVYAYTLGQNASCRDHLQHALPLIYTDPPLAASAIRFALKHTLKTGEVKRQDIGYGYCDPGVYMESDPQLYTVMAVAAYLKHTKNYGFLNETVTYYPKESGETETVLTLLQRQFIYLRDTVSTGSHGLIRMLNSDWSDSFFHKYSPNIYVHTAESHMNTVMALAILPDYIRVLENYAAAEPHPETVTAFIDELKDYRKALSAAFRRDMENRTFAPRCYLGHAPELQFGTEHICLEPQPFVLQIEDFPVERKKQLYRAIQDKLMRGEKFGARTREVPLWRKEGIGEDGGIWFSHQGQLILGVAAFDKPEAEKLLKNLTFHRFAEAYPAYWVGHWSFPDSIESSLSPREGLYHFWTENAFQPYCAHAHAWMLYCYFALQ